MKRKFFYRIGNGPYSQDGPTYAMMGRCLHLFNMVYKVWIVIPRSKDDPPPARNGCELHEAEREEFLRATGGRGLFALWEDRFAWLGRLVRSQWARKHWPSLKSIDGRHEDWAAFDRGLQGASMTFTGNNNAQLSIQAFNSSIE